MRYLVDTHALIWMRDGNPRMNRAKWEPVFFSKDNEIFFSHVSLWEIAIKRSLGKLDLEGSLEDFERGLLVDYGFSLLPLDVSHFTRLETLPHHHGDPFDRLLIAQAMETGAIAVTDDAAWKKYRVKTRW
jgi:PIN domain nuclease of toxin-antitoxin system